MAVTESKGNGYALYNGVKLPNIDTVWTDKNNCPYACTILLGTDYGTVISSFPFMVVDGVTVAKGSIYIFALTDGSWSEAPSGTLDDYTTVAGAPPFWASHDITNFADGSVYLAASAPIPLDGMNVIEWDGVTEGLEVVSNNYRLTDYREATNAIAVAKFDTLVMTTDKFDSRSTEELEMWGLYLNDINVILSTKYDFVTVFPPGIWCVTLDDGNGNTGSVVIAYTPATTEPEEPEEPDTPPIPKVSPQLAFTIGKQLGRRIFR